MRKTLMAALVGLIGVTALSGVASAREGCAPGYSNAPAYAPAYGYAPARVGFERREARRDSRRERRFEARREVFRRREHRLGYRW